MKKQILIAGMMLISVATIAQKKEIKKAEKALLADNIPAAVNYLQQAEKLLGAADNSMKGKFYLIKSEAYLKDAGNTDFNKMKIAGEALTMAESLGLTGENVSRLNTNKSNLRVALVNSAITDQNAKNYKQASEKLIMSYMTSKKDTGDLYYAAGNSVNAGDFDTALGYYKQLLDLGYTGIQKQFIAKDPEGKEVVFNDEQERDKAVLAFGHTDSQDKVTPSVKGDILQKVTLILINSGKDAEALEVMQDARALNPDDMNLVRAEADLAYKMGDMAKYNELMTEVVKSDPDNPELYYNLGVSAAQLGEKEKALEYYKKALEIQPNYDVAQINIAAIMLEGESVIVEEMNGLGMSRKDELRYDELKEKRTQLYRDVLPYLESASKSKSDNIELVRTLMNIYSQLGKDDKFKEMKAKLAGMEGGE